MSEKLLMRNEILQDGAPLPLMALLEAKGNGLMITDERVKAIWADAIDEIKELVQDHFPGVKPAMPELWELEERKAEMVSRIGGYAVTMDSYAQTGKKLLVSRHFALGGKTQLRIGNRPGSAPLPTQIRQIKEDAGSRSVVMLDDDAFTCGTAESILRRTSEAGITVAAFVPGLLASDREHILSIPIYPIERFTRGVRDVVDPRDLLVGLSDAGLAISNRKALYRAPYCLPYVDVTERASVPTDAARDFSLGVVDLNQRFFQSLESKDVLASTIYIQDLAPEFQTFVYHACPELSENASIGEFCAYTREEIYKSAA